MHTLACLTRQGAEELTRRLHAASSGISTRRVLASLHEGKMLVEYGAPDRETLERWLAAEKFHCDWLIRAELESTDEGRLVPI